MADTVQVEAARIPDRDRLLATLAEHGLPARPRGEVEIEIPLEGAEDDESVLHQVESLVFALGAPFVPIKHDGVIYVRPPIA